MDCKVLLNEVSFAGLPNEKRLAKLNEICESQTTAAREKLNFYCSMDYKGAIEYLRKDIEGITLCREDHAYVVRLPLAWVIGREGVVTLHVSENENASISDMKLMSFKSISEDAGKRVMEARDGTGGAVLRFPCADGEYKSVILTFLFEKGRLLKNGPRPKQFQAAALFRPDVDNPTRDCSPISAAFGEWCTSAHKDGTWGVNFVEKSLNVQTQKSIQETVGEYMVDVSANQGTYFAERVGDVFRVHLPIKMQALQRVGWETK